MSGTLRAAALAKQGFLPFFVVVDRKSPGNSPQEVWFGERGISHLAPV
jgi:hypothetical protein